MDDLGLQTDDNLVNSGGVGDINFDPNNFDLKDIHGGLRPKNPSYLTEDVTPVAVGTGSTATLNPELLLEDEVEEESQADRIRRQNRERQQRLRERRRQMAAEMTQKLDALKNEIEAKKRENEMLQIRQDGLVWTLQVWDGVIDLLDWEENEELLTKPNMKEEDSPAWHSGNLERDHVSSSASKPTEGFADKGSLRTFSEKDMERFSKLLDDPMLNSIQGGQEARHLVDTTATVLEKAMIEKTEDINQMANKVSDGFFETFWCSHAEEIGQVLDEFGFVLTPDFRLDAFSFENKEREAEFYAKTIPLAKQAVMMIGIIIQKNMYPFHSLFHNFDSSSALEERWKEIPSMISVRPDLAHTLYASYKEAKKNNLNLCERHVEILRDISVFSTSDEQLSAASSFQQGYIATKLCHELDIVRTQIEKNIFKWLSDFSQTMDFIQIQVMVAASHPLFPHLGEIMRQAYLHSL